MKRWMALAAVAAFSGCGSPTAPTPDFVGSYAFVVEASSVCALPVARYDWNLVATAAGGGTNGQPGNFRMTLPGGDPTLALNVGYQQQGGGGRRGGNRNSVTLSIAINAQSVPFGQSLFVTISGSTRGTATVAADGRGQVLDGGINGTIRLAEPGPRSPVPVGSCTAGDHHFTLIPL